MKVRKMNFLRDLQQDLKGFIFVNTLLMVFRVLFLGIYSSQLAGVAFEDVCAALWCGLRISMKTAGVFMALSFVTATLPHTLIKKWPTMFLRKISYGLATVVFTLLFFIRIPYYKIFNSAFNIMVLNGLRDDKRAIYTTAVQEYHLWPFLLVVAILSFVFCVLLFKLLKTKVWLPQTNTKVFVVGSIMFLPIFAVFVRFGGGYSYDSGIHWENAARTQSNLLNEAILDDGQALYRVYSMYEKIARTTSSNLSETKVRQAIHVLGGDSQATSIESAFKRRALGAKLGHKPKRVILIFGENNAQWPFLARYKSLNLVPYEEKIIKSQQAVVVENFLAGGNGTMSSLKVVLTGLAETGLADNYEQETYRTKYATGIGNVMKSLGYKTIFWYGGLGAWQSVRNFALAQGFDEFHGGNDIAKLRNGAWGIEDKRLFAAMSEYISEKSESNNDFVFHFVLTTSNHPPYGLDIDAMGFPRTEVSNKLPQSIPDTKETVNQLGHIWYADMAIGKFVENMQATQPDALFVITGDHAERFSFAIQEDIQALSAVPCIFYGQGVNKGWFSAESCGSHLQIMPTIVEMIAPKGFVYSALQSSLFTQNDSAFNHRLWVCKGKFGELDKLDTSNKIREEEQAAEVISVWRIKRGNII